MSHLNNTVLVFIVSFRPPAGGGQLTCGHGVDPELRKLLLLLAHMRGYRHRKGAELPEQPADLSRLHVAAEPDKRRLRSAPRDNRYGRFRSRDGSK